VSIRRSDIKARISYLIASSPSPTIRGKARGWIDSGIRFILINPIYKGTLIVSRNCHITDLGKTDLSKASTINVPAIVSESVWNAVQNRLRTDRKLRPPRKNP
jgi:hypothetical protein